MLIRKANLNDLNAIKTLADIYRHELGFVLRPALSRSIKRNEVFVAESGNIIGFVEYHHRKDAQTTLYHIVVDEAYRRREIGRALVNAVLEEAKMKGKEYMILRCPEDLPANRFYKRLGFKEVSIENGKNRNLIIWKIKI